MSGQTHVPRTQLRTTQGHPGHSRPEQRDRQNSASPGDSLHREHVVLLRLDGAVLGEVRHVDLDLGLGAEGGGGEREGGNERAEHGGRLHCVVCDRVVRSVASSQQSSRDRCKRLRLRRDAPARPANTSTIVSGRSRHNMCLSLDRTCLHSPTRGSTSRDA